jgi:hypothetical protein
MFAAHALAIPPPDDDLWIDQEVYEWRRLDEFAVCSSWTGHWAESAAACELLLAGDALPAEERSRVETNLDLARQHTGPGPAPGPERKPAKGRKKR